MVSIIVPAYNAERTIAACLNSIFAQSYSDWELIVVDDGSTDATGVLCLSLLQGQPNARYIRQENAGVAAARNQGMQAAHGEWLLFVDGDDQVEPELAEHLLRAVDEQTDIVCCGFTVFSDADGLRVPRQFFPNTFTAQTQAEKEPLFLQLMTLWLGQPAGKKYTGIGVPWGKLYRTELLRSHRISFPPLRRMQDNIFNMYAFTYARKIVYLEECLYRYRYDHVNAYQVKPEQLYAVLEAREAYFSEFSAQLSPRLRGEFCWEKHRCFGNSLKQLCVDCSFSEARQRTRTLCERKLYADMLREHSSYPLPKRYRFASFLGRNRLYGMLALLSRSRAASKEGSS